jgi:hypothetical protein
VPAPALAAVGSQTPTPSAKELWQTYPLETSPEPGRAVTAGARPTAAATRGNPTKSGGGTSLVAPLLVIVALVIAGVVLYDELRGPRARKRQSRESSTAPLPSPTVTARSREPGPALATPAGVALQPPDPALCWTAEIGWAEDADAPHFEVLAVHAGQPPVTLAESAPVQWPPNDAESIRAVSRVAETLSAALAAGGWRELSPRGAWYARRFAWDPPVPARRFGRRRGRPDEANDLGDALAEPVERPTRETTEAP